MEQVLHLEPSLNQGPMGNEGVCVELYILTWQSETKYVQAWRWQGTEGKQR